jgi:hypothetical protein
MRDPAIGSQSLHRIREISKKLDNKWKEEKAAATSQPTPTLWNLLADQSDTAMSILLYWNVMENTYRVLHGPTFWAKYRTFSNDGTIANEPFVAIMLLMVATVKCLSPNQQNSYLGLSSVGREEARTIISACENWLFRQSRKGRTIEHVQVNVLLYIAKRMNFVRQKRDWEDATALVTLGIQMGLHRDPNLLDVICRDRKLPPASRTSVYEKEMRRRLWATIIEVELQAAFDRGVLSSQNALCTDSGAPSNIDDGDFGEHSEQIASQSSVESYTSASFISLSGHSYALRAEVNRIINDPKAHITYDEMLHYHARIMQELESLPSWVDNNRNTNTAATSSTMSALFLDIQLRQYLLLLHLPFAQYADQNPRFGYSRMVCLNGANNILDYHCKLAATGNHVLNLLRQDVLRSALAVCHSIISWNSSQGLTALSFQPLFTLGVLF